MNFRDSYCTIQGWMIEDLHLAGNELIVYATIYGFCRDGQNWYKLSQDYVAKWAGITTRSLRRILTDLKEKGLLQMRNDGTGGCSEYITLKPSISGDEGADIMTGGAEIMSGGSGQIVRGVRSNCPGGAEIMSGPTSNNNIYNNNYNTEYKNIAREQKSKEKFSKPTVEEIKAYIQERNSPIDAEQFYAYYESIGWKVGNKPMKSWKMAIVTWEKRREAERKQNTKTDRTYGSNKPEGFDFFDF